MLITAILVGVAVVLAPFAAENRPEWMERRGVLDRHGPTRNGILP
jgi:hypothetical protein